MFLDKKSAEPLAKEHATFLSEFLALDQSRREYIMAALMKAREGQITETICDYIDAHEDEFYVFNLKTPEASDYRIYIKRDMTYCRMVSVEEYMYDTVLLESNDRDKVIELYNYAIESQKLQDNVLAI